MPLLEVRGACVDYGGVRALDRLDLDVEEGSIVGLIGPNGAGKTTCIDALSGFTQLSAGTVRFDGHDVTAVAPHERARRGLARTFQGLELFGDLTVREQLLAVVHRPKWWSVLADAVRPTRVQALHDVDWALELLGLGDAADMMPSDLSHGRQKLVGVARAIAARPRLLLLDEPAAGLDTAESHQLGVRLRDLNAEGITMVLIEHDVGLVVDLCPTIAVLEFGRLIAFGDSASIQSDTHVVEAYLGTRGANP
jgi:branched-chain amino acid transport system ATP-binding protein